MSITRRRWETVFCIPIFTCLFIYHMLAATEYWYYGIHEWTPLNRIDTWLYPFIIPTIYVLISIKIHKGRTIINGLSMLAFALINFTNGVEINLSGGPSIINRGAFYITIVWDKNILLEAPVHEFVMMFQIMWFIARLYNYRFVMKKEETHLDKGTLLLIQHIAFAGAVGTIGILLPESFYDRTYGIFILNHIPMSLLISACIYFIGKGHLLTPIIDVNNEQAESTVLESKGNIYKKTEAFLKKGKQFLIKDLQISDVAKAVGTNRTYISMAIQEATGDNFNTLINGMRVKEAKKLIVDNPDIKMDYVATRCGFGSASSFTKIFKKHTGETPTELRAKLRKASPTMKTV